MDKNFIVEDSTANLVPDDPNFSVPEIVKLIFELPEDPDGEIRAVEINTENGE